MAGYKDFADIRGFRPPTGFIPPPARERPSVPRAPSPMVVNEKQTWLIKVRSETRDDGTGIIRVRDNFGDKAIGHVTFASHGEGRELFARLWTRAQKLTAETASQLQTDPAFLTKFSRGLGRGGRGGGMGQWAFGGLALLSAAQIARLLLTRSSPGEEQ